MIPFGILMAALFTLIYLFGKLSEDINVAEDFRSKPYWHIIMAAVSGVAVYFWVESIFVKVTGVAIAISLIACIICIMYHIGRIDIPEKDKPTDKMSDNFTLKGKKGEIVGETGLPRRLDDDISYVGKLFENGESVVVYIDYIDGKADPGDEFTITDLKGSRIYAEITNKIQN